MQAAVLHGPRDVRVTTVADPVPLAHAGTWRIGRPHPHLPVYDAGRWPPAERWYFASPPGVK